ncbi:MAG: hypothetical protein VW443_12035, partial [Pseudomonadales bacterium]
GGANRLITDDGDGTVSTEQGFTIDGTTLLIGDTKVLGIGNGTDLELKHDTNQNYIDLNLGNLTFRDELDNNVFRIKKDGGIELLEGDAQIPATSKLYFDGGSDTYIHESAGDVVDFVVGGQQMLRLYEGGTDYVHVDDNTRLGVGNDPDLVMYHDATNSYITNGTGNLYIRNDADDKAIHIQTDDGVGGVTDYIKFSGNENLIRVYKNFRLHDSVQLQLGTGDDFKFYHDGSNNYIDSITSDQDLYIRVNDGGVTTTALQIDASDSARVRLPNDAQLLSFGAGNDLDIYHNGTDSLIVNQTGDLIIRNNADDKDIILNGDDGAGGTTAYLTLDGSAGYTTVQKLIKFEDSVDARFGSSSDLRIRHDGTDSKIDNYTGTLKIRNTLDDADITLETDNGAGGVTPYITLDGGDERIYADKDIRIRQDNTYLTLGASGSDMYMYHDGSHSWIRNNTGHLYIRNDSDGSDIYFGTNDDLGTLNYTMAIDGTNNRVGIGTTSPSGKLDVEDTTGSLSSTKDITAEFMRADGTYYPRLQIRHSTSGTNIFHTYSTGANLLTFGNGSSAQEAMAIDGSGNVGIGTTSPGAKFTVLKDGTQASSVSTTYQIQTVSASNGGIAIQAGDSSYGYLVFGDNADYDAGRIAYENANHNLSFFTNNAEKMRIDSSGQVGIGTSTPNSYNSAGRNLVVADSGDSGISIVAGTTSDSSIMFADGTGGTAGYRGRVAYDHNGDYLRFDTAASEAMRIDSSGNVGIGVTGGTYKLEVGASQKIGHYGTATNYGYFEPYNGSNGNMTLTNYWGGGSSHIVLLPDTNVGIGTSTPVAKLHVVGDGYFTGDVVAYYSSDKRLKDNITPIDNAI